MPVNRGALSRYRWIDERLRNKLFPKPTVEDIIGYVSDKMGKHIAPRTIEKDIYHMRYSEELNYRAPISYSRQTKTYQYEEEGYSISNMPVSEYDLQGLEIAISILEQFRNLPVIRQFEDAILRIASSLKINRERLKAREGMIHLDRPASYQGLEWITEMVEAMKEHLLVRIKYQAFNRESPREYWVEPYHLREYHNRFYLVGKSVRNGPGRILTFGLDRITDLWPTDKSFVPSDFDDAAYFGNVLGISTSDLKPETIELSFTPQQGKYIKSQPIHHSQRIIRDTRTRCLVRLELVINHELLMLLMSYGASVKVIRPKHVATRILEEALATARLYKA